jgi:DNA ligase-1
MRLMELVSTSRSVAESSGRLQKIDHLASLLKQVPPDELEIAIAFLSGSARQGAIGAGRVLIMEARDVASSDSPTLSLADVDQAFARIAAASGPGSAAAKAGALRDLLSRAVPAEQEFLVKLVFGELRQGALEGVLVEAVARASGIAAARVRRAAMLAGDLAPVARAALVDGERSLDAMVVSPFRPVQPMLAASAAGVEDALSELGEASLEYKLDGARIQVHKVGDEVRVFSRNLRDVSVAVPEVVEEVMALKARDVILDGEAIALRADGTPHPFQETMRRFGRRLDVDRLRETLPIVPVFFDCLYLDGETLIDEPLSLRASRLEQATPETIRVPRVVTASPAEAAAFLGRSRAAGHEGVMAKALTGTYAAGRRGQAWLKVKPARTLDLVVLAVEWGSGRRHGMLSNLHLGARDQERGGFVMLGKTFKGLTDAMLAWQTKKFLELELARDDHVVHVRPELVVEIAFNDIQASPHYSGRLALRFARVKGYRPDKPASEADTFATIQQIYKEMTGLEPPARM